jgi:UDP-glucose 4-epimerase
MTYLITGATGLIASRIANQLAGAGSRVIGWSRSPDPEIIELIVSAEAQKNITWVSGDILDYDSLVGALRRYEVDTLIHYAAIMGEEIKADPRYATRVNCEGTVNCFEAARELGLKKVLFASSAGAFPSRLPKKARSEWKADDFLIYPFGMYGAAKQYGEHAAEYYYRNWGTDITTLRICSICYGVGHKHGKSADLMRELLLKPAVGEPSVVDYAIDNVDTFLHADDAARAAVLALGVKREKSRGAAYNIKGPEATVRSIYEYVRELLPDASITFTPGRPLGNSTDGDTTATEEDLGFYPQYSIKKGVRQTIDRIRKSRGLPPV